MNGTLWLTWNHLRRHAGRSLLLIGCLAITVLLPVAGSLLVGRFERELTARARSVPLVLGAPGNRFDLVLAALWFRDVELEVVRNGVLDELRRDDEVVPIPVHARFTARGAPVVGTTPEYYDLYGLRPVQGTLPQMLGDAVLGAEVAREFGLAPGDRLFSDPSQLFDITVPPSVKLRVVGVLGARGTPDDRAVFVDVKTGWLMEGLLHGHQPPQQLPAELVLGERGGNTTVSEAMIEFNEVTPDNAQSFHFHGDPAQLPLTAVLLVPAHRKAGTMLKARINTEGQHQVLAPTAVVDELIAHVLRIKRLLDGLALALGAVTVALVTLVLLLSARMREGEMRTLHRIGCSRGTVAALHGSELMLLVLAALLAAGLGLVLVAWLAPDAVSWLAPA